MWLDLDHMTRGEHITWKRQGNRDSSKGSNVSRLFSELGAKGERKRKSHVSKFNSLLDGNDLLRKSSCIHVWLHT
jgi:hypothetical protein